MAQKITTNERAILDCLARNCYCPCNYCRPETFEDTGDTWTGEVLNTGSALKKTIKPTSVGGIVASLVRKGLARADGEATGLTRAGFEAWLRLFPADAEVPDPREASRVLVDDEFGPEYGQPIR